MESIFLFAAISPLIMTMVIPDILRDRETGEFKGFLQWKVAVLLVVLTVLEGCRLLYLEDRPLNWETLDFLVTGVAVIFIGGVLFVKYTHKELYGTKIKFTRWW